MAHYIDADKLKAEIERLKGQLVSGPSPIGVAMETTFKEEAYDAISSFLSTLEGELRNNSATTSQLTDDKLKKIQRSWYMEGYHDGKFKNEPMWNIKTGEGGPRFEDNPNYGNPLPEEPVCEELEEEYKQFVTNDPVYNKLVNSIVGKAIARHFAQWGAEHLATSGKTISVKPGDEVTINGHKIVYDKDKDYVTIVKSEESVPKDLEEAAKESARKEFHKPYSNTPDEPIVIIEPDHYKGFIAGAKWQREQFEKNRLVACDRMKKKEYDRETEFAYNFVQKNNRIPTFSDAINYGMKLQKEQMMKDAVEYEVGMHGEPIKITFDKYVQRARGIFPGDKVRIIIMKEDEV